MSPLIGGRWCFSFSIFHLTEKAAHQARGPGETVDIGGTAVGTAGDGREAQRQEVGSNFRNTTGNTIDILSAIDFAKRLQAAATSGKEAMPNEQSKVYTRRPLAFEKLSEAQDRQLRECGDESHVA